LPDNSLLIVLGDVCGHGVGPAILTAAFHAQLQELAKTLNEPEEIAARLNAAAHEDTSAGMFATLTVARLNPDSGILNYVNAGHLPGILLDSEGRQKALLAGSNLPLGIVPEAPFHPGPPVRLEDGDLVLLFTDGLVEARPADGPGFGVQRAIQAARNHQHQSPTEIIHVLHKSLCDYIGTHDLTDDVTIVVVKADGAAA
jgi:serine phosphatase RsbU (regulator of sigma subunit)